MRGWRIALALVAVLAEDARADELVFVAGGGPIRLAKRTPRVIEADTAVVRVEGGMRFGARTTARLRVETLQADGINVFADLVAEVDVMPWFGVQGFAGLSIGRDSGAGNHAGVGAFARWQAWPAIAIRADLFLSAVTRNDFMGYGVGLVAGVEWRPRR